MELIKPKLTDELEFFHGNQRNILDFFRTDLVNKEFHFEQSAQEKLSGFLCVGAMNQSVVVPLQAPVSLTEIAPVTISLPITIASNFITELKHRKHPCFFFVVLNHGRHGLVLSNHSANPTSETAIAAAGRRGINDERTFTISRCTAIHSQKILVGVSPRIRNLNKVLPNIVVQPVFDGGKHIRVRERTVGTKVRSVTLLFITLKNRFTNSTLSFTGTKNHDGLTLGIKHTLDKPVRGINFHSIRTPTEIAAGIGVATTDQVDPKGVRYGWCQSVRNNG